jgi:hypothetical protein
MERARVKGARKEMMRFAWYGKQEKGGDKGLKKLA